MTKTQNREWNPSKQVNSELEDGSLSPAFQYDRALGQFIVAQRLAPAHHVQEFWTAGIYQSCRLATALIQYEILDAATLENVLSQFQNNYLFCSRCPVTLQGRKNHYSRCPSCQGPWFEDAGWSPAAVQPQQHFQTAPDSELNLDPGSHDAEDELYESSENSQENQGQESPRSLAQSVAFVFEMTMIGAFVLVFGSISPIAAVFVAACLYVVKVWLQLLGRNIKYSALVTVLMLCILGFYSIGRVPSNYQFPLFLVFFVSSLFLVSQIKDKESGEKLGCWRTLVLVFFLCIFPFLSVLF